MLLCRAYSTLKIPYHFHGGLCPRLWSLQPFRLFSQSPCCFWRCTLPPPLSVNNTKPFSPLLRQEKCEIMSLNCSISRFLSFIKIAFVWRFTFSPYLCSRKQGKEKELKKIKELKELKTIHKAASESIVLNSSASKASDDSINSLNSQK